MRADVEYAEVLRAWLISAGRDATTPEAEAELVQTLMERVNEDRVSVETLRWTFGGIVGENDSEWKGSSDSSRGI